LTRGLGSFFPRSVPRTGPVPVQGMIRIAAVDARAETATGPAGTEIRTFESTERIETSLSSRG
jgi:hypothetical protein